MPKALATRTFGRTGHKVAVLGLGGAVLNQQSRELGFTYYDTSPGYCGGESQPIMGEGLEGYAREHLVATKVGYFSQVSDFRSPEALRRQIRENLRLLRRDYVDIPSPRGQLGLLVDGSSWLPRRADPCGRGL